MKKIVLTIALAFLSSVAFAKKPAGAPTPQNHSCVLNDAVVEKTKKECRKAGGKWEKNSSLTAKPAEEAKPADDKAPAEGTPKAESKPSDAPVK
jgi:hypothetical protein